MSRQNKEKKVEDYRLVFVDNKTHKQLWTQQFTKASAIITVLASLIVLSVIFYSIIAFTPIRQTIPGYPDARSKQAAIQNAIRADSLEAIIFRWQLYSENIRRSINGEPPLKIDSLIRARAFDGTGGAEDAARKDSLLRANVMSEEQFGLSGRERELPIEGLHFFTPLKGVISQGYDKNIHPYIDITAPSGSVVSAALDGTVVFADWSDASGYTIQIQHTDNIITCYKHNSKLLKQTGDKVQAGTPISVMGGTGSVSTGEHLHFELWHKGEAVDPTKYINF